MKKSFYIFLILALMPLNIFCLGQTEEDDYKQVSGKDNWEYEVPLEGKEPGVYNLLIRAKDKADNETFAGPYDVFIDPESDLPLVSITNPSSFMRVGGTLNIVGTARDDDAVKTVLLKINDGEFFEAVGSDFWSYTLDAKVLEDGQHTITAKAIDINGLEGHETSVIYNQDTLKPTNSVENYKNGAIFSGKVTINGKVFDANGISKVELSKDNQETYSPIKFKKDKVEEFYTFDLDIDTTKLNDGPNIYWIKSKDKTGSTAYTAFLFFVDNVGPAITIIDPTEVDILNGEVSISGKIEDKIGIEYFKFVYGDVETDIELKAGNPYWSIKVDLLEDKKESVKIKFISLDTSGNTTEQVEEIILNKLSDIPTLTLTSPVAGEIYKEDLVIEGFILDDDYVDGFTYTIDNGDEVFVKTFNSFSTVVGDLKSGNHTLKISAKDSFGTSSDKIEIPFQINAKAPIINLENIVSGDKEDAYYPGIKVTTDGGYKIKGSIESGNPITGVKYKLENGEFIELPFKKVEDKNIFTINVDKSFHYGNLNYKIIATDSYGNEAVKDSNLYVYNYAVVNDEWGVYIPVKGSSDVILNSSNSYDFKFVGPSIVSVKTEPVTDVVSVNFVGNTISIKSNKEGRIGNLKVLIETSKGNYESNNLNFMVDGSRPKLTIIEPKTDSSQSSAITLSGDVEDSFLAKVEYRFSNEVEFKEIKFSGSDGKFKYRTTLDIPLQTNESLSIEVKATDKVGNSSVQSRSFSITDNAFVSVLTPEEIAGNLGKSTDKPVLDVNFPIANETFLSEPFLSGFTRDDDSVKEIKISEVTEGGKSKSFPTKGYFNIPLKEFGLGKITLNVVSIDVNGAESKPKKISYNYEPNNSTVSIKSYTESGNQKNYSVGALLSSEVGVTINGEISGVATGDLSYSFNGDAPKRSSIIEGKYSIPVPQLPWGRNDIQITFTDVYGRSYDLPSFFYIVDKVNIQNIKDDNGIYFTDSRLDNKYVDISTEILSGIFKGRKIASVALEVKEGELPSFLSIKNVGERLEVSSNSTGVSREIRVVVTTVDKDVYTSKYFKFISDKISPVIELETKDDQFIKNSFVISGAVKDDLEISTFTYSINRGVTWQDIELSLPNELAKNETYTTTFPTDSIQKKVLKDRKNLVFSHTLDFANRKDSGYSVWLKVTDLIGNETIKKLSFVKDNTNPKLSLFIPGDDEVNGVISLIGKSSDNIELDTITYSKDGIRFTEVGKKDVFKFDIDFGEDEIFPDTFVIRATDRAGNYSDIFPIFSVNREGDKPVVQIQTPVDKEVIRNNFVISGMAFDDDSVATILYSLDGSDFIPVATNSNSFSVDILLESIENNEHIINVKAVDILGVESDVVTSTFWVSKEEPVSNLLLPKIEETKRDTIKLAGTSFDKNGIASVFVSTDNGVSYQQAVGTTDWNYTFNTKNIKDGTYSLFVKAVDKLNTEGFYSTLINIDNTPPELIINQPVDGDILSDKIVFSGRSMDNIGLKDVRYKIYTHIGTLPNSSGNIENGGSAVVVAEGILSSKGIFNIDIPLDGFEIGEYNIELIALDDANNRSISTRNFSVTQSDNAGDIEMLFPQPGSVLTSGFEVAGKILGFKPVSFVECYIDDELFSEIMVNEFNFFNLKIDTLKLPNGTHTINLKATLNDGQIYDTPTFDIIIKNSGPWLNIVNMQTGENVSGRPFITGEAGYIQPIETPEELLVTPTLVEVSLDNGQVFQPATGSVNWEFRLETWQYDDGLTPILVRATYSSGETKTSRIAVNFDRTEPVVDVIEKLEKGRFNDSIKVSGIASDSNGLTDISVILREGSKSNYEIPGLFQGMFIDVETGYGKLYGTGVGLTFFDDNVKLQFTYGQTRTASVDARIKGNFYGGKLLANIFTLEYGGIFGPDLENLSSSIGLGASFTSKTLTVSDVDTVLWYSSIVSQLEFIKLKLDNDYISSISLYLDFEATLISSENSGGFFPRLGLGSRITLF